ncbi:neuronal acetylcholine receptor subunit alpha-7-like isoform X1 [Silurus meridionalis]|nr:neuronal acetylcholine receptor subunit alpha-7-like isoform X1 [Silurus meridionalis]
MHFSAWGAVTAVISDQHDVSLVQQKKQRLPWLQEDLFITGGLTGRLVNLHALLSQYEDGEKSFDSVFGVCCLPGPRRKNVTETEVQFRKVFNEEQKGKAENGNQNENSRFTKPGESYDQKDEKNQVLTTNIWLQLYWTDYYLQWNLSDYPGVSNVRFPDNQIWRPDILLYNSADERFDATFHTNVLVNSSGYCQYLPPGIFKSTCYIDVRWFPFDVQRCDLKFGSWTYGGWSLDLQMMEADVTGYIANGEWDLVEVPGRRNERFYDCCKEPYPDITFTLVMRRRTLYYGLNLLIPCVLISTLALLVFLLPADSGEKISLGITVLLSLTVFMLLVAEIMPATSDSVPLIAQYFATTMVIVGLSVIATVLVLQYHFHDPEGGKMPKWTRVVLLNWCAWFLRMRRPGEHQSACHNKPLHRSSVSSVELCVDQGTVQTSNTNSLFIGFRGTEGVHCSSSAEPALICGPLGARLGDGHPRGIVGGPAVTDVTKILEEVRYITRRFRSRDENASMCNEWKFAAAVIDRMCLMAFSFFTILCTFGILMSAPNFVEAISKDFFSS